jgi:hypothetical protein
MGDYAGSPIVPSELVLRRATKADLDDITRVAQAGFPDDPEFNYRFPYCHKFPEDNWKCTRLEYEGYLDQPRKFAVLISLQLSRRTAKRAKDLLCWPYGIWLCLQSRRVGASVPAFGAYRATPDSAADHL